MRIDEHDIISFVGNLVEKFATDEFIAFDCETTGLSPWRDRIALIQLYGDVSNTLAIIPIPDGIIPQEVVELFQSGKHFIVHNGVGFDLLMLSTHNVDWNKSTWYDTLVGETLVVGSSRRDVSVSLRATVKRRLGITVDKDIEHGGWNAPDILENVRKMEYAARDVLSLHALRISQFQRANTSRQSKALLMEQKLVPLFAKMTVHGMPVTRQNVERFVQVQKEAVKDHRSWLADNFPVANYNSVKQIKLAFESAGIDVPNTKNETLVDLSMLGGRPGEIADNLIAYRHGAKRISMYDDEWIEKHIISGRIHPRYWQCSTDTTRVSSSDPNIQQIPKDGRIMVGGVPGMKIVQVDYSQIEVRVAAWIARDENLLEQLHNFEDVHSAIASTVFNVSIENVTKEQRKISKAMTFLLLFGGGPEALYNYCRRSGSAMTLKDCKQFVHMFFSKFKGLAAWKVEACRKAETGYACVRLPNGSARYLRGHECTSTRILNTAVQGTAAVGFKLGMLEANKRGIFDYIIIPMHDELVAEVPEGIADEYGKTLLDSMIYGMQAVIGAPITAELKIGDYWQP